VYRLSNSFELHAGPGLHLLFGDSALDAPVSDAVGNPGTSPSSYDKVSPTVFASLTGVVVPLKSVRVLAGLEARAYFFTDVDARPLSRNIPVANTFFGAFLGVEFPYGARSGRAP
jgi:hypothetical protein